MTLAQDVSGILSPALPGTTGLTTYLPETSAHPWHLIGVGRMRLRKTFQWLAIPSGPLIRLRDGDGQGGIILWTLWMLLRINISTCLAQDEPFAAS